MAEPELHLFACFTSVSEKRTAIDGCVFVINFSLGPLKCWNLINVNIEDLYKYKVEPVMKGNFYLVNRSK